MQAFHNDPAIKAKYQSRLAEHRRLEHLTQGAGFDSDDSYTKGCAVGCTLNVYDHSRYPVELGLPEWLARLEDRIFEGLPEGKAEQFAEDFLAAIPVGADVSKVRGQLAIRRHKRDLARLGSNKEGYAEECRKAIQGVIDWIEAGSPELAARSAELAAESAARSARSAELAAELAAESARSAELAAELAAESAAAESAESAARSAHWEWEAANLLSLLSEAV